MSTPVEIAGRLADEGIYLTGKADGDAFAKVMRHVGGDSDLAADAVLLVSRPAWLSDLIGDRLRPRAMA